MLETIQLLQLNQLFQLLFLVVANFLYQNFQNLLIVYRFLIFSIHQYDPLQQLGWSKILKFNSERRAVQSEQCYKINLSVAHLSVLTNNKNIFECIITDGFSFEVDIDASGYGVRYNQQWRSQIVGPSIRMDAAFKISVARQYTATNQIVLRSQRATMKKKQSRHFNIIISQTAFDDTIRMGEGGGWVSEFLQKLLLLVFVRSERPRGPTF